MAQTKIEKIASIEEEIKQLKERQKLLQQQHNAQERKDRTKRLCKRAGLLESMLPDIITLSDEQFKTFLEKAVANDYGRRMLASIAAQNTATTATPKPTGAEQDNATATAQTVGNGAGKAG